MVVILDNASIHNSKGIKKFLSRHPKVKLFPLPTYSPEYNPIEQVWKWLKSMVHHARTIENGIIEIIHRIRQVMWAWKQDKLVRKPAIGMGVWQELLFDYL